MKMHDIREVEGILLYETDKSFLILVDGEDKVWLPKSLVENNEDGTFSLPEWLAIEKGWV